MGAPSSCTYANIYTDIYITIFERRMEAAGIRKLGKYIDDIFFIEEKDKWQKVITEMGKEIEMELKVEKEDERGEIEFLDLKLIRNEGMIETMRNKKEYVSKRLIHARSMHSPIQKRETMINMIKRTIRLTTGCRLYDRVQVDIEEMTQNGYNLKYIQETLEEVIKRSEINEGKNWRGMMGREGRDYIRMIEKIMIIKECKETVKIQREIRMRKIL